MTVHLLDANVLIALVDPYQGFNRAAARWFEDKRDGGWATCPLTENAVLRVIGNPHYPQSPGSPAEVVPLLRRLLASAGHVFWPDSLSMLNPAWFDSSLLSAPLQLTDSYLLALAVANGGMLATFDRRLEVTAVRGGAAAIHLIAAGE